MELNHHKNCMDVTSKVKYCFDTNVNSMFEFHGQMCYEIISGRILDIIEWIQYDFFQRIWFNTRVEFLVERYFLGSWL